MKQRGRDHKERDHKEQELKQGSVSRRDFLKGGGALVAGAMTFGAAGSLTACSQAEVEEITTSSGSTSVEVFDTDVLILGPGVAGSWAALQAYSEGVSVLVVDKGPYRGSGAAGMNWDAGSQYFPGPVPENVTAPPWNAAGLSWCDFLANQKLAVEVENFVGTSNDAWNHPLIFARLGTPSFLRNEDGTAFNAFPPEAPVAAAQGLFPRNNLDYMDGLDISIVDNTMITEILVADGVCVGAMGIHVPSGRYRVFRAKATLMTTGSGCTQNYGWLRTGAISINSPDNTGDAVAAALRHGCSVINPEFLCYDLISFVPESLGAGFGAGMGADSTNKNLVCDKDGVYFLADQPTPPGYSPITRDAIDQVRAGKGGEHGGVFLNMADPDAVHLSHPTYRRNIELWKEEFDLDVIQPGNLVAIGVEAFESVGNVTIDEKAMTEIPGLFNSRGTGITLMLMYSQPVAPYAAHQAVAYAKSNQPKTFDWTAVESEIARLEDVHSKEGSIRPMALRHKIQQAVYDAISLGADAEGLQAAITEIERIKSEDLPQMGIVNKTRCFNLEWKQAIENHNLLWQAEATLRASLNREESRSFFYRVDFPEQDDTKWLVNSFARLQDGSIEITTAPVVTV